MKIVITGATGFLGMALAMRFAREGHQLLLPVRAGGASLRPFGEVIVAPPIEAIQAASWRPLLSGADAVVHAAGVAHIGPSVSGFAYAAVNRDATARLAEGAAAEDVPKFVFISSIRAQVGPTSPVVQTELTPPAPAEAYGRSKLEAEALVLKWLPQSTILRPSVIIGPEPRGNLATLVKLAALPLPLPFGALDAPQAMVSLDGVTEAVRMALHNPAMAGELYCLAERPHLSLAEVLTALRQGLGRPRWLWPAPPSVLSLPLKALGKAAMAEKLAGGLDVDPGKIEALGWRPSEPLTAVLRRIGAASVAR
jgi:nucleoside-diphosphate-sugar epimerase